MAEAARRHGITIGCKMLRGHPAKTIVSFASEGGCDLIVMGGTATNPSCGGACWETPLTGWPARPNAAY